jgi:hypothetical protein
MQVSSLRSQLTGSNRRMVDLLNRQNHLTTQRLNYLTKDVFS